MKPVDTDFSLDSALYTAGVTAELSGVAPRTLLAYEAMGLIDGFQTESGQRRYSERIVRRVRSIKTLIHSNGVNIQGAAQILDLFGVVHRSGGPVPRELNEAYREYAGSISQERAPGRS